MCSGCEVVGVCCNKVFLLSERENMCVHVYKLNCISLCYDDNEVCVASECVSL